MERLQILLGEAKPDYDHVTSCRLATCCPTITFGRVPPFFLLISAFWTTLRASPPGKPPPIPCRSRFTSVEDTVNVCSWHAWRLGYWSAFGKGRRSWGPNCSSTDSAMFGYAFGRSGLALGTFSSRNPVAGTFGLLSQVQRQGEMGNDC